MQKESPFKQTLREKSELEKIKEGVIRKMKKGGWFVGKYKCWKCGETYDNKYLSEQIINLTYRKTAEAIFKKLEKCKYYIDEGSNIFVIERVTDLPCVRELRKEFLSNFNTK
ncbi:MAG: hypothetical protein ACTSYD_02570 [Candidatus Heimdallarchaeaceae archaeon]